MAERPDDERDYYEFSELYGPPCYIVHEAAPGLPKPVLTVCGKALDTLLGPDECDAGTTDRECPVCFEDEQRDRAADQQEWDAKYARSRYSD